VAVLTAALTTHRGNERAQELAIMALSPLADQHDAMIAAGCIRPLLLSLKAYPASEVIQQPGLTTLYTLVTARQTQAKPAILSGGGVQVALAALKNFPKNQTMHQLSCSLLGEFAFDASTHPEIIAGNATTMMLTSLHTFRSDVKYTLLGFSFLGALSDSLAGAADVAAKGGIRAFIAAMTSHRRVEQIQQVTSLVLRNLAQHFVHLPEIAERGGFEALVAAREAFPAHAMIAECVAQVIVFAFATDAVRSRAIIAGGVKAVLTAVTAKIGGMVLASAGRGILGYLSNYPADMATVLQNGGEKYLEDARRFLAEK
jgi:hypothetical protein